MRRGSSLRERLSAECQKKNLNKEIRFEVLVKEGKR
jgi:hypothetical protein